MTEPALPESDQPNKRTFSFLRFFKRGLLIFLILLVVIPGTAVVIGYVYQDEAKEYVIRELNKQLNSEIIIDGKDIDFTVLKNFPFASLDFKNVKALEAVSRKDKDTLFSACLISLQFNILDVFKKNYHVRQLEVEDVSINLKIDKEGNDNFHFWKESTDSTETNFSFQLEKIRFENVHFTFRNLRSRDFIELDIRSTELAGNFSDEKYSLDISSDFYSRKINLDSTNFLRDKNVFAECSLEVDNTIGSFKIRSSQVKIENLSFEIVGNVITADKKPLLNLGIKGKDMDIRSLLSLIPNKYKGRMNEYESEGEFYFDATVKGVFSESQLPQIVADFGIKKATITRVKEKIVLNNVNLKGHYSNGSLKEPSVLSISPFSALIDLGSISGELSLRNLNNPSFEGKVHADISLEQLQAFVKLDTIETLSGRILLDAGFSGEGKNLQSGNYESVSTSGDLAIKEMQLKIKNNPLLFSKVNGRFKFDNNDLIVTSLSGNAGKSDVELKGFFRNMIGFMLKENQDITVEATLNSSNIDLNEILANKEGEQVSGSKYKLKFSEHINVNLNSEIAHLVFRKFEATDIKGVIKMKDKKMVVDPIVLTTMNGTITTSGLVDGSDSTKIMVTCFSDVNRINVTKMFEQFENFGQNEITEKNIKGIATAKIQFAGVLDPELHMDMSRLYAGVDMTIDNGELINVEAMKSMSRFIELKDLEHIRFSTLKNQIEIRDQMVTIPKMEVKSNAINITASGTHTFSNDINYRVKLSLNELLSKKAKKAKKQNEEFGEVADDGLGRTNIFLLMTGNMEDPVIKYDTKSAIQNVKQDLKVEKQTLKTILKEEFGMFKKDSALKKENTPKDNTRFTIQWDESEKKEEKKELKKPKKEEEEDF
ncbi:MAG: hypothetical protein M3R27_03185 [Bacteroidota bacterium]|nr:hypothetical protein [Bacteroidota bacterium]